MNTLTLSVCEFALPVPRVGSIETLSGYNGAAQGTEMHLRIQELRAEEEESYESEVRISAEFEREGYLFKVGGKMDGFFKADPPRIEEIKTSFNLKDLEKKLKKDFNHPYAWQLRTYGYFYYLKHGIVPDLTFHLVSTRTKQTSTLNIPLDIQVYEEWLEKRLEELVLEAKASQKRVARRKNMASQFSFPFQLARSGQEELMQTVGEGIEEKKRMLIQAPTGLGKTVGVLHPTLKEALSRGQRVVYITPKNSQHAVAEDAVEKFKEGGSRVKSLTITAKSKICFKNEPLCNPDYCEYAKDHYTKVYENNIKELLTKKRKLNARVIRKIAEEYQVCPFELQLDSTHEADLVICDYNYVFAPRSAFGQIASTALGHEGKPSLVIDEAHNLFARALGYYSPELSTATLERMRPGIQNLEPQFRSPTTKLLEGCIEVIQSIAPKDAKNAIEIDPPIEVFLEQEAELRAFLSRYLESDTDIQPKDVVLRLCFYWSEFIEALEFVREPKRPEFFTTFRPGPSGSATIRIVCCDASEMLRASYDQYGQVVGFSATLKPFDYYAKLSGLEPKEIKVAEFHSPFPTQNRKLLIIPEISTKFADREKNYAKISETIRRISNLKKGNYFAFFPSFDFLEKVLQRFEAPEGFTVLRQTREMKTSDANLIIEHLKGQVSPSIIFAVQGGIFSEGIDYPGEMVIGAFVVGPPLPPFELEREKMREYYDENHGFGFDYAYAYPAMAKAVQAAGRVIRSETDKGLIVLMDARFLHRSYVQSMPSDWYENTPQELVSRKILEDVTNFWK